MFLWEVTNQPFAVPKLALLAVAVAVAAALRAAEIVLGAPGRGLLRLALPASLVAVPALIAWVAGDYRSWSLWGAYAHYEGLAPTLLVVAAGVLLADAFPVPFRPVAWALGIAAGATGAYALLQSVGLDPLGVPVDEYAPSTIGHSNFVGGFLAIALPVVLALWATSQGGARIAALVVTVATATGLLLSFSQGGWLAAAGALCVYAGGELGTRGSRWRRAGWIAAGAVAAAGVGLVVFSLVRPFHPLVPETVRARGLWWREAVAMGVESPVWGHGPNVYAIEGPHHRNAEDALAHDRNLVSAPHSVPLSLFANHGLLGLAGFVALGAWTVTRGLAARGSLANGFAAGAAAYFVQSFVSIDMTVLTAALWVCLAALGARAGEDTPAEASPSRPRVVVAAALVVAVSTGSVWWAARFVAADARVHDAVEAFDDGATAEGLAAMADVVAGRPIEHYRHLYGSLLGRAAARERAAGADEVERMKEAFAYLDELPDVSGLATYAERLHQWSIYDLDAESDALEQLRRLLRLDRYSPAARVWTTEALLRLGRVDEALKVIHPMLPIVERFPEYGALHPEIWGAYAIAEYYAGDVDASEDALARGRELTGDAAVGDCHVLVAQELARNEGRPVPRAELVESSPGLLLCDPATVALLPGFDPQEES